VHCLKRPWRGHREVSNASAIHGEDDEMTADDVMTPNPAMATTRATVAEVWDLMRELEIRHVPVVDQGALVGMVSDRDLAQFDVVRLLAVEGAEAVRQRLATSVVELMTTDVIVVNPDTELTEIVDLLVEQRIGAIPVVRTGTRDVVGIVSYIDVLEAVRGLLEPQEA
jgi:CBS domain-containing protein